MWLCSSTQTYQRSETLLWYERPSGLEENQPTRLSLSFHSLLGSLFHKSLAKCIQVHTRLTPCTGIQKCHPPVVVFIFFLSVTPFLKEYQNLLLSQGPSEDLWSTCSPDYLKQLGRLTYLYHWHVLYLHYQVPSVRFISTASTLSSLMKIILRSSSRALQKAGIQHWTI